MILTMYALKDELNGFTSPIPFMSEELAKRYFKDQVMSNPTISNTPEDFSLYMMGAFDTQSGIYSQKESPKMVERASSYVNK